MKDALLVLDRQKEEELISIRRHLHQYPELSFQEFETAAFIKKTLRRWGIAHNSMNETGIYVDITGSSPGPVIGIRADIDALPIAEKTGLEFQSQYEGRMHACGHDGHTTILLGAVRELHNQKAQLHGTIRCIFQPGEEADGAANELIKQGVLESPTVSAMFGLHLWPHLPHGSVGLKYGSMTASCDDFEVTIKTEGGHGARPHQSQDAIAIAGKLVQEFQYVVSKQSNPVDPCVIHVGKFHGGTAINAIANETKIGGTIRALSKENREHVHQWFEQIISHFKSLYGVDIEYSYQFGEPSIVNADWIAEVFGKSALQIIGKENIHLLPEPSMGADDFGYFSEKVPSLYFRLGTKENEDTSYDLHHPKFQFNDSILKTGVMLVCQLAIDLTTNPGINKVK